MKKIGFKDENALKETKGTKEFTGVIRSDGVDLEFVCTKPTKKHERLTPSAVAKKVDLNDAIIWGVDPGIRDIFVACDGGPEARHRVRKTSTAEYYHLIRSDKRRIINAKLKRSRPAKAHIISQAPTFKSSSVRLFIEATIYVFRNYDAIINYYDHGQLFNKLNFARYVYKQKALHEISLRLLAGSAKYRTTDPSAELDSSRNAKWKPLGPQDREVEASKPIVIAFGAAQFGNLRGNIPAPTKVVRRALERFVKARRAPTYIISVDEYLTSQICPQCATLTTDNEMDSSNSSIYPVKACSTCHKRYNRDHMAAMNIRNVFLHMAAHNDERPPVFARD